MTEHQAWAALAKAWAGPEGDYPDTTYGLCRSIIGLNQSRRISNATEDAMSDRLRELAPPKEGPHFPYRWACGAGEKQDRKSRAAFCRRMARLTGPKGKVKSPAAGGEGRGR